MKTQINKSSVRSVGFSASHVHLIAITSVLALLLATPSLSRAATNRPPNAVVSLSSVSGSAPFATTFDATKSKDSDGTIVSYNWNFGDGTTSKNLVETHTYTQPGTVKASLKITDNKDANRRTSVTITVQTPPPPIPAGVYSVVGRAPRQFLTAY
ncbi:MAG: PKD domain-containing protein [Methylococcaceae bacterium]